MRSVIVPECIPREAIKEFAEQHGCVLRLLRDNNLAIQDPDFKSLEDQPAPEQKKKKRTFCLLPSIKKA